MSTRDIKGADVTADFQKITASELTHPPPLPSRPSELVHDHDFELCSTLDDRLPLLCGHLVRNLGTVSPSKTVKPH